MSTGLDINIYNSQHKNDDFNRGIYSGLTVIIIAGLGDKMFFINMIYASMNEFWGAFAVVLIVVEFMNIVNLIIGEILQKMIGNNIIEWAAIVIFLIMGICLVVRGFTVENRLIEEEYKKERTNLINAHKNNGNRGLSNVEISDSNYLNNNNTEIGIFDSWWKYFLIYFVGSFLDKSQIATIFITSKYNFSGLWIGSSIAQLILVFISMTIGKCISKLLTNRQLSFICGIMFLILASIFAVDKILIK